jgi:hypothetical protein
MHIIVFAEILRHQRHHLPKLTLASQKKPNLLAASTFFLRSHLLLRAPLLEILLNNNQPSYQKAHVRNDLTKTLPNLFSAPTFFLRSHLLLNECFIARDSPQQSNPD